MTENRTQEPAVDHPLHVAVAEELERRLEGRGELIRDPACIGTQESQSPIRRHHLPLFVGREKGRDTRMCQVDLLVVSGGKVQVIVEIEESDFKPTTIYGKFLQAALSTHFIHDSQGQEAVPYDEQVLFLQVIDASQFKDKSQKQPQGDLIAGRIQGLLQRGGLGITQYRLFFVGGKERDADLKRIGDAFSEFLT